MPVSNSRNTFRVQGMTCAGCEAKIERILSRMEGISEVRANFGAGTVNVSWDSRTVSTDAMAAALDKAGYTLQTGSVTAGKPANSGSVLPKASARSASAQQGRQRGKATPAVAQGIGQTSTKATVQPPTAAFGINQILGIVIVLVALYFLISRTIGFDYLPEISQNMGLGMLFVVGLLTSIHCVAMCGGINLSQCVAPAGTQTPQGARRLWPSLLYNGGRVISYTLVGGLAGALGAAVSFSGWAKGIVAVVSGVFMVVMGLSMMGIPFFARIAPRMPRFLRAGAGQAGRGKGPFLVGLLNGLMPCGPLQAMQLYALGTGSFFAGASSMLVFSLGTVPLMFGLGALSTLLSTRFTRNMMRVSAALVLLLGFVMVGRGLALSGVALPGAGSGNAAVQSTAAPETANGTAAGQVQNIDADITSSGYPNVTVQAGSPVRLNFKVAQGVLTGCNRTLVIPKFNKQVNLKVGDNIVEFTPTEAGNIAYSCWMGMIQARITVLPAAPAGTTAADGTVAAATTTASDTTTVDTAVDLTGSAAGSCCAAGAQATRFVGGKVPVDDIAFAKEENGMQVAEIHVSAQGYSPAAIIAQKGKLKVRFIADDLNSCNSVVVFPDYNGSLDLGKGELETPALDVTSGSDLTFQCGMGMLHGYIKIVDDVSKVNVDDIKNEISDYVPADGGASCCG